MGQKCSGTVASNGHCCSEHGADVALRCLTAIFQPDDLVLFRPIETWTEEGRKKSLVAYHDIRYCRAAADQLRPVVEDHLKLSADKRLNLFFGVCPRFGSDGRFDLLWQIRTVLALWTDIDNVTVEEARQRIAKAGLPVPSIIVISGSGVHVYWVLDEPYLIDDVPDPPGVETEWTSAADGRKKPRKYVLENGERLYLHQQHHLCRLSGKAQHFQDVLAGVAKAVGGDHATDLSRLLRLPGTLNRKDERNGREPVPTALVECEPSRRYPLAAFERLKAASPTTERAKKIAAMPLPTARRPSAARVDKLSELIAISGIATAGQRSEADFAVCCYAVRSGITKEEVWAQVENVGKFAEGGRRYFDVTWDNAEYGVKAALLDSLRKRTLREHRSRALGVPGRNGQKLRRCRILVNAVTTPVATTLHQITNRLLSTGSCYSRADQLVVVDDQTLFPISSAIEFAGLLSQHAEFIFGIDEEAGQHIPLPPNYANTWLNNRAERGRLPAIKLFTRNPVYMDDWRLIAPGFDEDTGIYYAGPRVEIRHDTDYLDTLLRDFCFKSPADRTNYIGMLLTAILMPRFIGSKPAVLFNGNQPGLGKSILAQIIATLRDGQPAETASYNPNDEEFEKRLCAVVRRGATTIVIDNAKGGRRSSRIESACLERCITDLVLSFRLLGQSAEVRAENSHIFCITANTPDISRDLVTRSVVVNLYYEGDPRRRVFSIPDPEEYALEHRHEVLGELIGMVERWKAAGMPRADVHSRFNKRGWGTIVGGILHVCGEPDFLANSDEAASTLDETRREFSELIAVLVEHPQGTWTAAELVELCNKHGLLATDLGDGSARSWATKMGTLAGRFVSERFPVSDGRQAIFQKSEGRKGKIYRLLVDEVPNPGPFAEPLPNLETTKGSAP